MSYNTLNVSFKASSATSGEDICFIQMHRPEANNTINGELIEEIWQVIKTYREQVKIIVLSGLPEVFCFGADFAAMANEEPQVGEGPQPLYDLWRELSFGPFVTIAHVRGKANAGGIGFVAACDLVLSETRAEYSLSEMLFGLMPAYVMPFLIRRIGFQRAHAMTISTTPVSATEAKSWALVDDVDDDAQGLLNRHLRRLRRLNKKAIARYKDYLADMDHEIAVNRPKAIVANEKVFHDQENMAKISRYVTTGQFPWE